MNSLQKLRQLIKEEGNISDGFEVATGHDYKCRCDLCKEWWRTMGPEEPGDPDDPYAPFGPYGPFTVEEIESDK